MTQRRQRGEGAVYQRHDHPTCPPLTEGPPGKDGKPTRIRPDHACKGTWTALLDLGWRDGKRRRKPIYGPTQKAVIAKLTKAKQELAVHGDLPTAGMTVETWLRKWLTDICPSKPRMRPKTLKGHQSRVENYLIPAIGRIRLDKLKPDHVRQVRDYVLSKGLSTTTALHAHRVLSTALNDAVREGLIPRNVTSLVPAPARAKARSRSLTITEVEALLKQVAADRYASRWLAGLLLGLRQGELLGLEWDRVDLQTGTIDVSWQLQRVPYRHTCGQPTGAGKARTWPCGRRGGDRCPERTLDTLPGFEYRRLDGNLCLQRPKSEDSTRLIPLPVPLLAALGLRWEQYLAERDGYRTDHGLVWPRVDGRPTDGRKDWQAWSDHLTAAGIEHETQHTGRHTTATLLLALRIPEHVIQSILGHSDAITTRRYQHVDLTMQRTALTQLATTITTPRSADRTFEE